MIEGNFIGTDITGAHPLGNFNDVGMIGSNNTIGGLTTTPGTAPGNVISGAGKYSIYENASDNLIAGNLIGTDAGGRYAIANAVGMRMGGTGNTVGGTAIGARNIISAAGGVGVQFDGAGVQDNVIQGNYVGTDITGTVAIPNRDGVYIALGATNNTVGGTAIGAGNVVSASTEDGVGIGSASNNTVVGNLIGTTAAGTAILGNGWYGMDIQGPAAGNMIGGTSPSARNVISGNSLGGVHISLAGATANTVEGNFIGTDVSGTLGIPNAVGVLIDTGASGNAIGSIAAGAGNTIADNTKDGVQVIGPGTTGDAIRGNSIFANGLLGIELGTSGVPSTNILGGSTTGPNEDQNYPVLTIVSYTPGIGTTIAGNINSTPNSPVSIDFYSNPVQGFNGFGQGQTYVGSVTVNTTNDGNASFTFLSASLPHNAIVSATATDPGNTSEFSRDLAEDTPPIATVIARPSPAGAPATTFNEGQTIAFDGSGSFSPDGDALTYTWDFNDGSALVTTATSTYTHAYHYDGTYVVTLTVNDGHGGIESNIDILTIKKLPPTITFNSLPTTLAVGTTLNLSGTIADPTPDLETVIFNWGDGSNPTTLQLPAGSTTFATAHDYASPLPGGATTATLSATVTDASNPAASPEPSPIGPLSPDAHLRRRRPERIDLRHAHRLSASAHGRRADTQPGHRQRRRLDHAFGDDRRPGPGRLAHGHDSVGRYTRRDHPGASSWRPDVFKRTHLREHARRLALGHVADRCDGRQQRPSFGRSRTPCRHRRRRVASGADREPAAFDHRLARFADQQRIRAGNA